MDSKRQKSDEFVEEYQWKLLAIQQRLYLLKEIEKQFERKVHDGKFNIGNRHVLIMYYDSFDMLINDLVSFCKSLVESGGFFDQLLHHSKSLCVPGKRILKKKFGDLKLSHSEVINDQETISDALDFIFPRRMEFHEKLHSFKIQKKIDIKQLKDRYALNKSSIQTYRDDVSAHRYQLSRKKEVKYSPPKIGDLEEHLTKLEELFNKFRLIFTLTTFGHRDVSVTQASTTADDITELILFGSFDMCITQYFSAKSEEPDYIVSERSKVIRAKNDFWDGRKVKVEE